MCRYPTPRNPPVSISAKERCSGTGTLSCVRNDAIVTLGRKRLRPLGPEIASGLQVSQPPSSCLKWQRGSRRNFHGRPLRTICKESENGERSRAL